MVSALLGKTRAQLPLQPQFRTRHRDKSLQGQPAVSVAVRELQDLPLQVFLWTRADSRLNCQPVCAPEGQLSSIIAQACTAGFKPFRHKKRKPPLIAAKTPSTALPTKTWSRHQGPHPVQWNLSRYSDTSPPLNFCTRQDPWGGDHTNLAETLHG